VPCLLCGYLNLLSLHVPSATLVLLWKTLFLFLLTSLIISRTSFCQSRRIRAIRRSVSLPPFSSTAHAFICSKVDYCNSILIGLPKIQLGSTSICIHLTWLFVWLPALLVSDIPLLYARKTPLASSLCTHIQFKILFLVYKALLRYVSRYLCKLK